MKIILDAFGGDNAPLAAIEGAALAVKELGVQIVLVGDTEKLSAVIKENNIVFPENSLDIIDAPEVFDMHEEPTSLLKKNANTSLAVAFKALASGQGDALVSAGSTGAIVVGGTLIVKRIKGVKRPALGSMIPAPKGSYMLMDMGANAECRPEMLAQFGVMSSVYLSRVMGRQNPTIALLNIGTEDTKGGALQLESYKLLEKAPINFVGNVESREMPRGVVDGVVTDGFTGNIALKLIEGTSITMFKLVKEKLYKNIFNKLAALVIKKDLYELKSMMDATEVGGAPLLGVAKPVIKAHGNSTAVAFKNAIRQAKTFTENDVIGAISADIAKLNAEAENEQA